jgi:hypothetical protein
MEDNKRHAYEVNSVISVLGVLILAGVWIASEYVNHGGWPSGVTLGTGGEGIWNLWIVYPVAGWILLMGLHSWFRYIITGSPHH